MFQGPPMVKWGIVFTKTAEKDSLKLGQSNLKQKAQKILDILRENPYQNPPRYEKLIGDLEGYYSRRINIQHRLVYQVLEKQRTVKIVSMWHHYE